MRRSKGWSLLALLLGACAIPNIDVVDTLDDSSGGASKGGSKNTSSQADEAGADSGDGGAAAVGGSDGSGGTSSTPPAGAVFKFCNAVTLRGVDAPLELRIGSGSSQVSVVATTGTCTPVVTKSCAPMPLGAAVPLGVYDLDGTQYWQATPEVSAGDAWIFALYFDEDTQMPSLIGESDFTAAQCSAADFDDVFPDSSTPDGT